MQVLYHALLLGTLCTAISIQRSPQRLGGNAELENLGDRQGAIYPRNADPKPGRFGDWTKKTFGDGPVRTQTPIDHINLNRMDLVHAPSNSASGQSGFHKPRLFQNIKDRGKRIKAAEDKAWKELQEEKKQRRPGEKHSWIQKLMNPKSRKERQEEKKVQRQQKKEGKWDKGAEALKATAEKKERDAAKLEAKNNAKQDARDRKAMKKLERLEEEHRKYTEKVHKQAVETENRRTAKIEKGRDNVERLRFEAHQIQKQYSNLKRMRVQNERDHPQSPPDRQASFHHQDSRQPSHLSTDTRAESNFHHPSLSNSGSLERQFSDMSHGTNQRHQNANRLSPVRKSSLLRASSAPGNALDSLDSIRPVSHMRHDSPAVSRRLNPNDSFRSFGLSSDLNHLQHSLDSSSDISLSSSSGISDHHQKTNGAFPISLGRGSSR